ncbi:hypothetical protein E2C01_020975 [Portunus trituberculatus]|uniref:Uncharacterized protein n=1 Tax=Portunus trituberculatus TaxID=210409 RepID=A0A5B7E1B0_PORTR|nr:hypothetical protein [Portunus trituberculatus]
MPLTGKRSGFGFVPTRNRLNEQKSNRLGNLEKTKSTNASRVQKRSGGGPSFFVAVTELLMFRHMIHAQLLYGSYYVGVHWWERLGSVVWRVTSGTACRTRYSATLSRCSGMTGRVRP